MLDALRRSSSAAVLLSVNVAVGATVAALVGLTLMEHFEETPEIKQLACALGVPRTDCPEYGEKLERLEAEIAGLEGEKDQIEAHLAALRAIEDAVDEITLFEHLSDPTSGVTITIGTVYRELVDPQPRPTSHFCYINLTDGSVGESRTLYIHGKSGALEISQETLTQAEVSAATEQFARSVCKPYLIASK